MCLIHPHLGLPLERCKRKGARTERFGLFEKMCFARYAGRRDAAAICRIIKQANGLVFNFEGGILISSRVRAMQPTHGGAPASAIELCELKLSYEPLRHRTSGLAAAESHETSFRLPVCRGARLALSLPPQLKISRCSLAFFFFSTVLSTKGKAFDASEKLSGWAVGRARTCGVYIRT